MNCNRLTCCRHPSESGGLNIILSPRWPGGEGRVRGAGEPVCGAAHLTLPSLREGPLPLPLKGGEGLVPPSEALNEDGAARNRGRLEAVRCHGGGRGCFAEYRAGRAFCSAGAVGMWQDDPVADDRRARDPR